MLIAVRRPRHTKRCCPRKGLQHRNSAAFSFDEPQAFKAIGARPGEYSRLVREGIAVFEGAAGHPLLKPMDALIGGAVGKGFGADLASAHALNAVVTDGS